MNMIIYTKNYIILTKRLETLKFNTIKEFYVNTKYHS